MTTMDFFQHQEDARRHTGRLVLYFGLAVVAIMLAAYLVVAGVVVATQGAPVGPDDLRLTLWDWRLIVLIGLGTLTVVSGGSAYKVYQLRGGGPAVAEMLGGRLLHPETDDHAGRVMLNVVEEMSIASGVPVPPVYVMENEGGINAFAAGRTMDDAVIGITRGALDSFSRDELQGVVAHEFSHIFNGDMRLNIRLMGLIHGILVIGLLGYTVLRTARFSGGRRSGKDGGGGVAAIFAIALGLIVVGFTGVFFGNLIKAAVSRQREYLADASAVQFTRNPEGVAGALKTIGGHSFGSSIEHKNASEASHMYFANGVKPWLRSAFATHPPLAERIQRIDPGWDGTFPEPKEALKDLTALGRQLDEVAGEQAARTHRRKVQSQRAAAHLATAGFATVAAAADAPVTEAALSMVGRPSEAHFDHAAAILAQIPDAVRTAAHEPFSARAVIHALLLNFDAGHRELQLTRLREHGDAGLAEETARLAPLIDALPSACRLPLIDLALPALRELTQPQYRAFVTNVAALVAADEHLSFSEWVLQRLFLAHLAPTFEGSRRDRTLYYRWSAPLVPHIEVLLSTLARVGQAREEDVEQAFDLATGNLAGLPLHLRDAGTMRYSELDFALDTLAEVSPPMKKQLLASCSLSIAADQQVTEQEAELFRAVSDSLGVPVPPLLPGQPLA